MKNGRSPRYCNRGRLPEDATVLLREDGKAWKEEDPRVRKPPLDPKAHLRVEGWVIFFALYHR